MPDSVNSHREFLKSPHHAWLGLLTLGTGIISGQPLGLVLGLAAYALGWVYLPDLPFFTHWVARRQDAARRVAAQAEMEAFNRKRNVILESLSRPGRERYDEVAAICRGIEDANAANAMAGADPAADPRLRKLDELMWTFLRLLSVQDTLDAFLETERSEDVPGLVADAEREIDGLGKDVEQLKAKNETAAADSRQRVLESRLERLSVLRKRQERMRQAQSNLDLVVAEEDRLDQQIRLIRADAAAARNAANFTARIDATVEHLDETNKWLAEMDEFKDLAGDMPQTEQRVGFGPLANPAPPPLVDAAAAAARRTRTVQAGRSR